MTHMKKMKKILTSGRTTGEILEELEILRGLRELRSDIKNTRDEIRMQMDLTKKLIDKMIKQLEG